MLLTLFVDLIVAVGIGVFIANIIIIEKLSRSQAGNIKRVSDVDDRIYMDDEQRQILRDAQGQVALLYLSGPMIFGVARALAREQQAMQYSQAVVVDLSDVNFLDDTIALSIENFVEEAVSTDKDVYLIVHNQEAKEKLMRMGMEQIISEDHFMPSRTEALRRAAANVTLPDFA